MKLIDLGVFSFGPMNFSCSNQALLISLIQECTPAGQWDSARRLRLVRALEGEEVEGKEEEE